MSNRLSNFLYEAAPAAVALIGFFIFISPAAAARFVVSGAEAPGDQTVAIKILINTENDIINAVEGTLAYPENLKVREIRDGGPLVGFWVKRPQAAGGKIAFSGLLSGGLSAERGELFSVIFDAEKGEEGGIVTVADARAFVHDGLGSAAKVTVSPYRLTRHLDVKQNDSGSVLAIQPDTVPPDQFFPIITKTDGLFDGQWFVVFSATDRDSGIDHYEIQESRDIRKDGTWQSAETPRILNDQSRGSYVYIRAVDRAGNERLAVIPPRQRDLSRYAQFIIWCILIVIGFICLYFISRRYGGKHPEPPAPPAIN